VYAFVGTIVEGMMLYGCVNCRRHHLEPVLTALSLTLTPHLTHLVLRFLVGDWWNITFVQISLGFRGIGQVQFLRVHTKSRELQEYVHQT